MLFSRENTHSVRELVTGLKTVVSSHHCRAALLHRAATFDAGKRDIQEIQINEAMHEIY